MGLRRRCARRFSLPSVQQKHAAWDCVCRSSNGPCSTTTVALTSLPAQAALPLALRCPRLRTATSYPERTRRAVGIHYSGHEIVSLDYLFDRGSLFNVLVIMFA